MNSQTLDLHQELSLIFSIKVWVDYALTARKKGSERDTAWHKIKEKYCYNLLKFSLDSFTANEHSNNEHQNVGKKG